MNIKKPFEMTYGDLTLPEVELWAIGVDTIREFRDNACDALDNSKSIMRCVAAAICGGVAVFEMQNDSMMTAGVFGTAASTLFGWAMCEMFGRGKREKRELAKNWDRTLVYLTKDEHEAAFRDTAPCLRRDNYPIPMKPQPKD